MNFKLLTALILIPFAAMAQNRTNEFDNVLINRGITFKGGTPGLNKVLTSDAGGNYTPQTLTGLGAFALTNAPNFFTTASPNTFNGLTLHVGVVTNSGFNAFTGPSTFSAIVTNTMGIVTSNLVVRGGLTVNRVEKTANYTNVLNDYYIAWKGTTAGQVTNFLPTGVFGGKTYVIKDAQRSASTTNIVIKPLSSDTIGGASSLFININGQSYTITYDGVSNWEPN